MTDHLAHLEADAAAVVAVLRDGDPDAAVPYCPGWTLRDLALHLGGIHRWVTTIVRTGERSRPEPADVPDDALADWSAEGASALLEVLRGPERACWTLTGPGTSASWVRRQALETVVHRVDAQRAAGQPWQVDDDLGEDGVDEVLTQLLPRQVELGRCPAPATGALLRTSTDRLLGADPPTATVAGPAGAVLLLLWRRLPRTDPALEVSGDLDALDRLLETPLTP